MLIELTITKLIKSKFSFGKVSHQISFDTDAQRCDICQS